VNPPQTPLQLESFFVEALAYRAREGFDLRQAPLERVDVNVNSLQHKDSSTRFMVRLQVKVGQQESSNARCDLDLMLVGFFVIPEGLPPEMKTAMHGQNAPSILYGVARQIVAETTGNGPWGKVFLPTMNFVAASGGRVTAQPEQAEEVAASAADRPPSKKRS
jgi:preprotein translocase subunit SecB